MYEAGDLVAAEAAFVAALGRVQAPTIVLMLARTRERQGRLRDAYELYRDIVRRELDTYDPVPYHDAQQSARVELQNLEKRMPALQIRVAGAPPEDVYVLIDGKVPVAPGELEVRMDPGRHEIMARAPGRPPVKREVVLEGNAIKWVWLTLAPPAGAAVSAPRAPVQTSPAEAAPVPAAVPAAAAPPEQEGQRPR